MKKTLSELKEVFGDRNIVLAREITKIHEEFLRGKISELEKNLSEPKGEFVIVVEGFQEMDRWIDGKMDSESWQDFYKNQIDAGIDKKTAIRETAIKFNLSRREVYNSVVEQEKNLEE